MKKIVYTFFFFFLSFLGFSRSPSQAYFYNPVKGGDKYFISVGYGVGTAHWSSVFKGTEFYDKDGAVINNGDLKFSANSPTKHYDANVSAPIKHIRCGLGISFEQHYLAQLKIYTKDGQDFLLFDEGLRFDKMYLHLEVPFKYDSKQDYSINWDMRIGWFGYTNIKRFNFVGERATSFLVASGFTVDYEMYPKVYVYLFPNLEFKYYDNSRNETSVDIRHRVFTANIVGGIRVDLGNFSNNSSL